MAEGTRKGVRSLLKFGMLAEMMSMGTDQGLLKGLSGLSI